jgi:hypothetical protein
MAWPGISCAIQPGTVPAERVKIPQTIAVANPVLTVPV